jgi:hypothetical protein
MVLERVEKMGEHKRNQTAIYFKENPWAPDFRPLLGKRRPRGRGIRRVYKILMERQNVNEANFRDQGEERAELTEPVIAKQEGKGDYQLIKLKGFNSLVSF